MFASAARRLLPGHKGVKAQVASVTPQQACRVTCAEMPCDTTGSGRRETFIAPTRHGEVRARYRRDGLRQAAAVCNRVNAARNAQCPAMSEIPC